jgi:hypothetical protein
LAQYNLSGARLKVYYWYVQAKGELGFWRDKRKLLADN